MIPILTTTVMNAFSPSELMSLTSPNNVNALSPFGQTLMFSGFTGVRVLLMWQATIDIPAGLNGLTSTRARQMI